MLRRWILWALVIIPYTLFAKTSAQWTSQYATLTQAAGQDDETSRFRRFLDLHWSYLMEESPEAATYTGFKGLNGRWSDLSSEAIARRKGELKRPRTFVQTLASGRLSEEDRLWLELFDWGLRRDEEGQRFPAELMPLTQMNGVQQDIAQSLSIMPGGTVTDFDDMVLRLKTAEGLVRETLGLLREGLKRGITMPRITLRDVPQQVLNQMPEDPSKSPLYRRFIDIPETIPEGERARLRASALADITYKVYPAYRELHRFLVTEYVPGARESIACSDLPEGVAWYAHAVRRSTTTEMTPQEIHAIGQGEVKRIRAEMDAILLKTGFKGTLPEFLIFLRSDKRFFFDTAVGLLAGYRDISKRIDGELPRLFGRLPRLPYGVVPIPSYSEKSQTTAYYQPSAWVFRRPGNFFANTYALDTRPKWEMEALTLHEAVPGHHLQIALSQELDGVPDFQKHSELTVFVEGWGLYAESLGADLGLYRDPYSKFGQLTYEMWRAIRLVVDTGIHSIGWSRRQAIEFFKINADKSEHDIVVEVDRYIVWPRQALAYKIGELKIQELRRRAEVALGQKFDLRAFHDALLEKGALPLEVLERRLNRWIEARRGT
ncbi:MAG: DUF885 domain-containing protein [Pedosphaera sp.]|nr:DUF885 domain-containing protein [Pedosphaera sp.]